LNNGQSRFCSSVLHQAFIFPKHVQQGIRQNMKIEPMVYENRVDYALIQIMDITDQVINENRLKEVIKELKQGYEQARESEKASKELARFDHLTGLYNRAHFETKLTKLMEDSLSAEGKLAFLFMDLDGFKQVNDKYGHLVGDILLQQVAGRLLNNTRKTDIVARMGGDEFIIIQNNMLDMEDAITFAEKLVNALKKPYYVDNKRIHTSVSIGISVFPDMSDNVEILIKYADAAMYNVKKNGKNNFGFYEKKSNKKGFNHTILD
jgi:diguanylate cyclase (GGDEF) domain